MGTALTFDTSGAITLTDSASGCYWYYSGTTPGTGGRIPVVGDNDGHVFQVGWISELSGTPVADECYWTSQVLDFGDQNEAAADKWKNVYKVRLLYEDISTTTPVTVHVSHDGGVAWTSVSHNLGTGDGKPKYKDYFFSTKPEAHGQHLQFKVSCPAVAKDFVWTGLHVIYTTMGNAFAI